MRKAAIGLSAALLCASGGAAPPTPGGSGTNHALVAEAVVTRGQAPRPHLEGPVGARWQPAATRAADLLTANPAAVILALGESAHDDPVSLGWRNAVALELVRRDAVRLVLFESGFAEARMLDDYVLGRGSLTPATIGQGFTNGLGLFAETRALVEALRQVNAARPADAKVRVAGVDLSTGGPWGSAPGIAPVDCALEALPERDRGGLRAAFEKAVRPGLEGAAVTAAHIADYGALIARLTAQMPRSAGGDQRQCLRVVAQGMAMLETLPPGFPGAALPADAWRNIEARDRAMAENALALGGRAQGKPLLLLAHLSHVAKTPMRGPRWARLTQSPRSTGYFLHARLGGGYRAMLEVRPPDPQGCPAVGRRGSPGALLVAADLPAGDCAVTVNGSDSQLLDLSRSVDAIQVLGRDS
jgi:erythromycin esterase-like protein